MTQPTIEQLQQIVRRIDAQARLLRSWPLAGGVSAQTTALEIALPDGTTQRLVIRQHGEADRAGNPNIAADEFRLLHHLQSAGLPVPAPYLVDASGDILPTP